MFDDYFDDNTISGGWTQSFTTGSGLEYTLVVSGTISGAEDRNYLRIYGGSGDWITNSGSNGIYQTTSDDFDVEICLSETSNITYSTGAGTDYQLGMALVVDEDNYIYIFKSLYGLSVGYKADPGGGSSAGSYTTNYSTPLPCYFGATKSGSTYNLKFSDINYSPVPSKTWTLASGACDVWLFCNSPNADSLVWVDFDYFITVS